MTAEVSISIDNYKTPDELVRILPSDLPAGIDGLNPWT